MKHDYETCARCGAKKLRRMTDGPTVLGIKDRIWWICDGCGIRYQYGQAPNSNQEIASYRKIRQAKKRIEQ